MRPCIWFGFEFRVFSFEFRAFGFEVVCFGLYGIMLFVSGFRV